MKNYIQQRPTPPNEWLYLAKSEDERLFAREVARPVNTEPWPECTIEEKEQWEREHPQPEPPEE